MRVLERFQSRSGKEIRFTAARQKLVERRLRDWTADELIQAIDGFMAFRDRKPGRIELSTVLDSYPGGAPVDERIEFWISQAEQTTGAEIAKSELTEHERLLLDRVRYTIQTEGGERKRGKAAYLELQSLGYRIRREGGRVWLTR